MLFKRERNGNGNDFFSGTGGIKRKCCGMAGRGVNVDEMCGDGNEICGSELDGCSPCRSVVGTYNRQKLSGVVEHQLSTYWLSCECQLHRRMRLEVAWFFCALPSRISRCSCNVHRQTVFQIMNKKQYFTLHIQIQSTTRMLAINVSIPNLTVTRLEQFLSPLLRIQR